VGRYVVRPRAARWTAIPEILHLITQVGIVVFIVGSMAAMGLGLTIPRIVEPLRDVRLVAALLDDPHTASLSDWLARSLRSAMTVYGLTTPREAIGDHGLGSALCVSTPARGLWRGVRLWGETSAASAIPGRTREARSNHAA
jgi:hypothetical protein